MFRCRLLLALLCLSLPLINTAAHAEEVSLQHQGLTLNANLALSDDNGYQKIVLITHGTLAHNDMELIRSWQSLLNDEGISSLAINLSLAQDNRHGMYDCAAPHRHQHSDATAEITAWIDWLKQQGSEAVILAAHSRGGNQTAWYSSEQPDPIVKGQILLAPQTWSEQDEKQRYETLYQTSLDSILTKARQADANSLLEHTDFLYCPDTAVSAASFLSYYAPDKRLDTPTLLRSATLPTLVLAGSEDTTSANLDEAMQAIDNSHITTTVIEGADHFFRDLYMDEVIEHSLEFMESL